MRQYKYSSYSRYVRMQQRGFQRKSSQVWANKVNIQEISRHLASLHPVFGICHGSRAGAEQRWFREFLKGCEVIGTEIGGSKAPYTVQWDFNQPKPEWKGKADFIYSNSFDHVFAPEDTLKIWMGTLRTGGLCVLEHSTAHEGDNCTSRDPLRISLQELVELIPKWVPGARVHEVLELPGHFTTNTVTAYKHISMQSRAVFIENTPAA